MSREDGPVFIRRKFTIPEPQDAVLVNLADRHYQGNVSLCLRAAIEDHRESLNGQGKLATQRLAGQVDSIRIQQEEILDEITEIRGEILEVPQDEIASSKRLGMSDEMWRLYSRMNEAKRPLRVDDLIEQLELPLSRVQPALGQLIDQAYVVEIEEGSHRYGLPGYCQTGGFNE
ncbi:hypothetical protein GJ631_02785 [Natronomonas sp. CBA1123]|jgi:hypothetical protein|uniref:hypothetical protein n=1 Tax=Natronomonas sp. CBA1123 TaxID=2668070 RepID=UPI0012E9ACD7|nr:hypothetical protein [Natronomonas sp. CBA1123]MUV85533.1 hypothetical protein [Natronomonas sp. CBA1123]